MVDNKRATVTMRRIARSISLAAVLDMSALARHRASRPGAQGTRDR